MKRTYLLLAAGLIIAAASHGQPPQAVTPFQQVQTLDAGGRAGVLVVDIPRDDTGRPYSATATTETAQTYRDGTHVSRITTVVQYRDAEGRTRMETTRTANAGGAPVTRIVIRDPVARVGYSLDPVARTAIRTAAPRLPVAAGQGGRAGRAGWFSGVDSVAEAARRSPNKVVEDLGTTTINGLPARGTRITTVIPVGAIGNDREFRSVDERWYSPDLNMLIKSVSTDPRFGTTTHEMTNISRLNPDLSLFQLPAGYKIVNNGPREQ